MKKKKKKLIDIFNKDRQAKEKMKVYDKDKEPKYLNFDAIYLKKKTYFV